MSKTPTTTTKTELTVALDKLKACIHCGMCLPACPTYRVTGSEAESPRGRLYLMKSLLDENLSDGEHFTPEDIAPHIDQCLGCLACQTVCPSGVQYGGLLTATRETITPQTTPWFVRFIKRFSFQHLLPYRQRLVALASFLGVYERSGLQILVRRSGLLGLLPLLAHQESLLPKTVPHYRALKPDAVFGPDNGVPVVLFVGCVMDTFYNAVHWDTIRVLAAQGYRVSIGQQTCCGALAHHAGERDIVENLAGQNVAAILASEPAYIVVNSAGCGATLQEYSHILTTDEANTFSSKVIDIMALLAKAPLNLDAKTDTTPITVTYHAACHLHHAQGVHTEPMAVLDQLPNVRLVPLTEASMCCGSAGIYNLQHPTLSEPILDNKINHVLATNADVLVTGNPGCLLQIEKGLKAAGSSMRLMHPVSFIASYVAPLSSFSD